MKLLTNYCGLTWQAAEQQSLICSPPFSLWDEAGNLTNKQTNKQTNNNKKKPKQTKVELIEIKPITKIEKRKRDMAIYIYK